MICHKTRAMPLTREQLSIIMTRGLQTLMWFSRGQCRSYSPLRLRNFNLCLNHRILGSSQFSHQRGLSQNWIAVVWWINRLFHRKLLKKWVHHISRKSHLLMNNSAHKNLSINMNSSTIWKMPNQIATVPYSNKAQAKTPTPKTDPNYHLSTSPTYLLPTTPPMIWTHSRTIPVILPISMRVRWQNNMESKS